MGLFKNMLTGDETIFKEEIALDLDYKPLIIKHRENQQHHIATCIKPLLQDRNGKNLIITGAPGIGKTLATQKILDDLEQDTDNIIPIYINCWKKDTPFKIALEICNLLEYKFTHNKDTDALLKEICSIINKKSAVIVLDEIDKLSDFSILYSLLEDINKKTLILITNEKTFLQDLDIRIRSRLTPEGLEFKEYNYDETADILKQRIEQAFFQGVISPESFDLIANKTFEARDIRTGLYLLKESGDTAELNSSKKVLPEHTKIALEKLKDVKIQNSSTLEQLDRDLLNFIKLNSGRSRKEIFDLYSEDNKTSYRTFHRKVQNLESAGFISIKSREYGKSNTIEYIEKVK